MLSNKSASTDSVLAHIKLGEYQTAIKQLQHATHSFPDNPYIAFLYGSTLSRVGRLEEATHYLKKSALVPDFKESALLQIKSIQYKQHLAKQAKYDLAKSGNPSQELLLNNPQETSDSAHTLTIACLKWGNWGGSESAEYVNRLYSSVQRHLSLPHRFVCFTDNAQGISSEIEILPLDFPDWSCNLRKIVLYKPNNGLSGRVVAFDLDTIIVGSIDKMCSYNGTFCSIRDFYYPYYPGGGILAFQAGDFGNEELWEPLIKDSSRIIKETGGSERYYYMRQLCSCDYYQDLYPNQVVSYKIHCQEGLPTQARVVCFHGEPRPHELSDKWVTEHWRT